MTLTILFLLFVISFVLSITKRKFASILSLSAGLLLTYLCSTSFFSNALLQSLQIHSPLTHPVWKQNNIILLLAAGNSNWQKTEEFSPMTFGLTRTLEAARLYFDCKQQNSSCQILASGGDPSLTGFSEAQIMKKKLQDLGVSESDIVIEEKSLNTIQNAQASALLLKEKNYDNFILVTSGYHMKRALLCFYYNDLLLIPAPADHLTPHNSIYPQAINLFYVNLSFHEYAGIFQSFYKHLFKI